ncbi:hypothetical protein BURPS305_1479 [Burkholderia pseudomallei 305]|nr:hypothetical protein BURPS305_1479 [Burkholderia pseudomallei 305]EDU07599.1 hypothetical protein BURPS1655_A2066 [Burkholderia pseudomallei 1655]
MRKVKHVRIRRRAEAVKERRTSIAAAARTSALLHRMSG